MEVTERKAKGPATGFNNEIKMPLYMTIQNLFQTMTLVTSLVSSAFRGSEVPRFQVG